MKMISIEDELKNNSYPGRGIIIGRSADGTKAVSYTHLPRRYADADLQHFLFLTYGFYCQIHEGSRSHADDLLPDGRQRGALLASGARAGGGILLLGAG